MNISSINSIARVVEELKSKRQYRSQGAQEEEQIYLNNILAHIANIEGELDNLRMLKNSSASKIIQWYRNFSIQNPQVGELFKLRATESTFSIMFSTAETFNLNLAWNPEHRWTAENQRIQFAGYFNRPDCERAMQIINGRPFEDDRFIPPDQFAPLISHESSMYNFHNIEINFKTSKRLFKDEDTFDKVMGEVLMITWNKCLHLRNP